MECCVTSTLKKPTIVVGNHVIFQKWITLILMTVAGFECLLVKDATDGYVGQERKMVVVDMITGNIFEQSYRPPPY
jgi:hypothetical protein